MENDDIIAKPATPPYSDTCIVQPYDQRRWDSPQILRKWKERGGFRDEQTIRANKAKKRKEKRK